MHRSASHAPPSASVYRPWRRGQRGVITPLAGLLPTCRGDHDHLRLDPIGLPAVHEARQPLLIARVEEITHIRRANETRGIPHLAFHGGYAVGMGDQRLDINHETRVRSARAHY